MSSSSSSDHHPTNSSNKRQRQEAHENDTEMHNQQQNVDSEISKRSRMEAKRANEQYMKEFWKKQLEQLHAADLRSMKGHELPLARIKKIMKSDEDVRMISAEAPVLFAKACELFIYDLTMRAWEFTDLHKRRTLQRSDVCDAVDASELFDFLVDIVPRDPVPNNHTIPSTDAVRNKVPKDASAANTEAETDAEQPTTTTANNTTNTGFASSSSSTTTTIPTSSSSSSLTTTTTTSNGLSSSSSSSSSLSTTTMRNNNNSLVFSNHNNSSDVLLRRPLEDNPLQTFQPPLTMPAEMEAAARAEEEQRQQARQQLLLTQRQARSMQNSVLPHPFVPVTTTEHQLLMDDTLDFGQSPR